MADSVVGPPPPEVVETARSALAMARQGFGPASVAGLQVATALIAGEVSAAEVNAIRSHKYEPGSVTAGLFGDTAARAWLDEASLPVRTAATTGADLAALSARLNTINRRFRDRVETVIAQSMRQAVRHAMRKANTRVKRAATYRVAAVREDLTAGHLTGGVLAAIDTDMAELLDDQFSTTSDHVVSLFDRRQRDRREAIRQSGLDVTDDQLDAWGVVEDQRRDNLRGFVFGGLMGAAASYLTNPDKAPPSIGEIPRDVFAPPDVVSGAVRVADGAEVTPSGHVAEPDGVSKPNTFDYTDQLITDLLAKNTGKLVTTYEWVVGEPDRPFEPHQELAGATFTDDTWTIVCANPTDWPESTLLPGDHAGCQCELDVIYSDAEEAVGEE